LQIKLSIDLLEHRFAVPMDKIVMDLKVVLVD